LVSDSSKFGIIPAFEIAFFLNAIAAFWIFTVKSPLNAVIFLAVGFSAFYILLSAANLILKWSKSRLSPTKHAFMMNLLLIAIGALAGINSIVSNKGSRQGFVIGLVEIIFLPLFGWSFMAFGAVQNQRERMEQSVLELNQVLKWEVARARMQQWQHRNWITRTLHGPVQNAIGGSAVKIDLALQAGEPTGLLKTELQEYIDSTIEQLSHFEMQVDFQSNLMQLKGFYAEVCKIFTDIDEQTLQAITRDLHAATATYEIIQEAVWNSIHHGSASEVEIRISLHDADLIELGIDDNGSGGTSQVNPEGLGTSMLEAVTLTWSRTFSKSGTSLRALITVK
jgi:signal transduction histidine kinase